MISFSGAVTVTLPATPPAAPWLATYVSTSNQVIVSVTSPAKLNGTTAGAYYVPVGLPSIVWTDGASNYYLEVTPTSGNFTAIGSLTSTSNITAANATLGLGYKQIYTGASPGILVVNASATGNAVPQIITNVSSQTCLLLANSNVSSSAGVLNVYGTTYSSYVVSTGGITTNGTTWTVTTGAAHGFSIGQTVVLGGLTPTAYNGSSYTVASTPTTTSFTITNSAQPGAVTVAGVATTQPFTMPPGSSYNYQGSYAGAPTVYITGSNPQSVPMYSNSWTPQAQGFQGWTGDPATILAAGTALTTGTPVYSGFTSPITVTAASVTFNVTSAATLPANCYVGIYSQAGVRLAVSSDFSSTLGSNTGNITVALTSSVTLNANTIYYLALLVGATTSVPPSVSVLALADSGMINIGTTQSSGTLAGGGRSLTGAVSASTLPSPFTGTPSTFSRLLWLGIK